MALFTSGVPLETFSSAKSSLRNAFLGNLPRFYLKVTLLKATMEACHNDEDQVYKEQMILTS